jgi:hypothetical protein
VQSVKNGRIADMTVDGFLVMGKEKKTLHTLSDVDRSFMSFVTTKSQFANDHDDPRQQFLLRLLPGVRAMT